MVRPRNEAQDNAGFYAKEAVTSMLHAQQLNGDTDSALDDALRTNATHRTFTLRAPQMNDEAGRALPSLQKPVGKMAKRGVHTVVHRRSN